MPAMLRLDHIVLVVRDLVQASWDFGGLGFNVVYGGEHAGGETHNALVPFSDGSYLELIAWRAREQGALADRWSSWRGRGEGLADFALAPADLGAVLRETRARGLELLGPLPGGRSRPDGAAIAWELAVPDGFDLPFLCCDVTARSLRVPSGPACAHPNGVVGLRRIAVDCPSVPAAAERYKALLGAESTTAPLEGALRFQLGATAIDLVPSVGGEGIGAIELSCSAGAKVGPLPARYTHGAPIDLVAG